MMESRFIKRFARIGFIGILHTTCYLWFIPKVILPKFGSTGGKVAVVGVILTSLILVTLMFKKKKK